MHLPFQILNLQQTEICCAHVYFYKKNEKKYSQNKAKKKKLTNADFTPWASASVLRVMMLIYPALVLWPSLKVLPQCSTPVPNALQRCRMMYLTAIFGKIWRYSRYANSHLLFGFLSPSCISPGLMRLLHKHSSPGGEVIP